MRPSCANACFKNKGGISNTPTYVLHCVPVADICMHAESFESDSHSSRCGNISFTWAAARATEILLWSMETLHNTSPWVPSRPSSESSAQQNEKGERGAGMGGSFRVQGSIASSPLFSFLTVFPEHMTRLNPKPQPFCAAPRPQSHLSLLCSVFFFFSVMNV